ncbi:hypothetical protein ACJMK2_012125 [Sinanodonta woodiana]|uniref:Mucin-like protein n=1 Tax=Sinanodonta woodiana TaxID=1069815 RepID=A0ABD3VA80_SINWO
MSSVTGVTGVQSNTTTSTENTAQSTPSACNVIAFDNSSDFNFYYGSIHGDTQLKILDYCDVNRITPIPVFGNYHNLLYVCDHGIVSFNNSYTGYIPSLLTNAQGLSLLAAYHSDSDPRNPCSVLYYHIYDAAINASISDEHNVRTAEALVKYMTGRTSFTATFLLVVTWHKILYFPSSQQNPNHSVSYQLVLVSDGQNTYTMYKYFPGEMKFNRSIDVFIGYMFTTGEYFQHPLSFTTGALRIDQHVETKGEKGILFYPLTHEVKNKTEDQRFEFGQNIGDQSLSNVDDNCTDVQNSYRIPLFTNLHTKIYVCSNGIVTFDKPFTATSLQKKYNPKKTKIDILMPYLTDIQISFDGQIYYQVNDVTKDSDFRKRPNVINAESIVRELKTNTRYFEAQFLLVVTWLRARPYDAVERRTGLIFYQLTNAPYQKNIYRHKCIKWYARNSPGRQIYSDAMTQLPECPCTLDFLRRDPRYVWLSLSQGEADCSYLRFSWWFNPSGVGKTCCYSNSSDHHFLQSGPYAGGFVRYHPWLFYNWHVQEDLQMREYCCDREDLCDLYHGLRPIGTCYTTFPLQFAIFWGDPHIETLDGRKYTFNGLGEYTLINMESGNTTFSLQARTARVEKKDGNLSDATIFSAFAAKDDRNVHINVELNRTKNGLLVFVNTGSGVNFDDYTIPFADESFPFTVNNENVSLLRTDETKAFQAVFSSGISMTVALGMQMLSIAVVIPKTFSGKTKGLLGNFDGNDTNEFICANGTLLENTIQDREIFQFGQSWRTSENESIFRYPTGKGHADFSDPTFIPQFLDEADPEIVANATEICGEENQECIFDLVFTENNDIAQETLQIEIKASQDQIKMDNTIPSIKGPDLLQVVLNKTVTYFLNATDDGTFQYKFLSNDVGAILTVNEDHTANVSFRVTDVSPIVISVIAEDVAGVQSVPSEPEIVLCTGCNGHGICNFNIYSENSQASAKFKYSVCVCDSPWSGANCEEDYDGCSSFPCSTLRNCTDIPADMHNLTGKGYNCSDCPSGYNLNETQKCQDINECLIKHDCNQSCQNTEGTYVCSCSSGFRLHSDGKTCQDIDECSEATSKCDQICTNTAGGYNCSCFGGFTYNSTSQQCLSVTVSSACMQLNCTQTSGCATNSDGNATCFCRIGYHLTNDGVHCKDDDECTQNACQQTCHNTDGSYQCSCYAGYKLDSDKKTCKPCDILTFGENCNQTCQCGQGVERCDTVKGCVCKAGWTGSTCEADVNECNEPNVCANALKVCVNTNGSYECNCVSGYIKDENGTCIDINECMDPVVNLCEQVCVNTPGAFFCSCNTGFTIHSENKTNCIDIDECSNGQSGCQHICKNTAGKFACDCYYGYSLAADRKTCDPVEDPCSTYSNLNCSHICLLVDNTTSCSCKQGFELMEDQQTCREQEKMQSKRTIAARYNACFRRCHIFLY